MLSVVFGDIENAIFHPPTYFDNQYEDEWITHPLTVEMIKDIDKSKVISAHLIESPVLGPISPKEISGGVKTYAMISLAAQMGESSGIDIQCEKKCRTLDGLDTKPCIFCGGNLRNSHFRRVP